MKLALIALRIMSIAYLVLGPILITVGLFYQETLVFLFIGPFLFGLGILYHQIRKGLVEGKYWAWVSGIIVSALSLTSLFFPLGIMGLYGLLNRETRQAFNRIDEARV